MLSAAKAFVAKSSAPVIRMRVMMVFMIGSVVKVWVTPLSASTGTYEIDPETDAARP